MYRDKEDKGKGGSARAASIYFVLIADKCLHVAALFWAASLLNASQLPVSVFTFWVLATASCVALVLKKPWRQKMLLPGRVWLRVICNAVVILACCGCTVYAARTLGPLRTAILGGVDTVIFGVLSVVMRGGAWSRKGRGLVLALLGIVLLVWPLNAASGVVPVTGSMQVNATESGDGSVPDSFAETSSNGLESIIDADSTGSPSQAVWAAVLAIIAATVSNARRIATRRLAVDLGGRKRCHTVSISVAALIGLPIAAYNASTWDNSGSAYSSVSFTVVACALMMGIFTVVLGEYMHAVVASKLKPKLASNASFAACITSCIILSLFTGQLSELSSAVLLGMVLLGIGKNMVVAATTRRKRPPAFGFGQGGLGAVPSDGVELPLYTDPDDGDDPNRSQVALMFRIRRVMRHVLDDADGRKIFFFLVVNLAFMFVELLVGWWTNSLGLISDAGHMFFDNASLFIGLYASYMAKWRRDDIFTYGYGRYEVLAGFVNAIFLVFVGFSVVLEGLERLFTPPEIHGDHLLTVAVLGLLVNLIGIFFFADAHGGHGHTHGGHGHSHGNDNMEGIFLHVLADTLGSVGVIVSSLLIKYKGWYWSDAGASLFISALILLSVIPLVKNTASVLLSGTPPGYHVDLRNCFIQIASLDGVLRVWKPHAWKLRSDVIVVTLHIQVEDNVDEQPIREQAITLLQRCGVTDIAVQIEKQRFLQNVAAGSELLHATEPLTFHRGMTQDVPLVDHDVHHGHSHGGGGGGGGHGHANSHGHSHSHDESHGHSHGLGGGDDHDSCRGHGHSHGDSLSRGHSHGGGAGCSDEHNEHGSTQVERGHHGHSHGTHSHAHDSGGPGAAIGAGVGSDLVPVAGLGARRVSRHGAELPSKSPAAGRTQPTPTTLSVQSARRSMARGNSTMGPHRESGNGDEGSSGSGVAALAHHNGVHDAPANSGNVDATQGGSGNGSGGGGAGDTATNVRQSSPPLSPVAQLHV